MNDCLDDRRNQFMHYQFMSSEPRKRHVELIVLLLALAFGVYHYSDRRLKNSVGSEAATQATAPETAAHKIDKSSPQARSNQSAINAEEKPRKSDTSLSQTTPDSGRKSIERKDVSTNAESHEFGEVKVQAGASSNDKNLNGGSSPSLVVSPQDAKGAVDTLYQAILWRPPDGSGGASAVEAFSRIGWETYIGNAKEMITSKEFSEEIVPRHNTESIINRMYAIFLNRCSTLNEMKEHLAALTTNDPGRITDNILSKAIDANKQKIFEGGYRPESCKTP